MRVQVQKTGTGRQEKVEAAMAKLFPSSRAFTAPADDTGVHALGMANAF